MKYLVLRTVGFETEYDSYDYYHNISGVGVPTEHVIDLTDDEIEELKYEYGELRFIPILDKDEVSDMIKEARKFARERAAKRKQQEDKKKKAAAKRRATLTKKKKEKELKQLEELKRKYE
jgi:hypothetical protein